MRVPNNLRSGVNVTSATGIMAAKPPEKKPYRMAKKTVPVEVSMAIQDSANVAVVKTRGMRTFRGPM
jgi:hypothetical protein